MRQIDRTAPNENADYLKGYRDGIRERRSLHRPRSGDGLLGALLAIALIAGIGYFGYSYATTGTVVPADLQNGHLLPRSNSAQ